uniref:DUF4708 domain-containing protein n=1 Tax=Pristionchus pacificus TaxID=54126 RepID=A0A8R1Z6L3_PRIPA
MLCIGKISPAAARAVQLTIDKPTDRSSAHAEQCATVRKLIGHTAIGGVIGHPVVGDVARIVILIRKEFVEPSSPSSALFDEACRVLELKVTSVDVPDGEVIEQCIRYTLCVWLEPEWCRVGDALMQSAFLYRGKGSPNDRLARIEVAVSCSADGDVLLSLKPSLMRVYIVEPWFLSDAAALQFDPKWACCLPKLGKGRIVGVHRRLPPACPFPSWAHIRHYWGNAYGYHLPSQEPEAYYDVLFNGMKKSMIYPYYCVCSGEPEEAPFRMAAEAAAQTVAVFEATLNRRRPTMLGEKVRVAAAPAGASARLAYASAAPFPVVRKLRKIKYAANRKSLVPATAFREENEEEEEEDDEDFFVDPAPDRSLHRTLDRTIAKASPATTTLGYGSGPATVTAPAGGAAYKPRFGGGAASVAARSSKPAAAAVAAPPRVPAFGAAAAAATKKKVPAAPAEAAARPAASKATPAAAAPPAARRKRAGIKVE